MVFELTAAMSSVSFSMVLTTSWSSILHFSTLMPNILIWGTTFVLLDKDEGRRASVLMGSRAPISTKAMAVMTFRIVFMLFMILIQVLIFLCSCINYRHLIFSMISFSTCCWIRQCPSLYSFMAYSANAFISFGDSLFSKESLFPLIRIAPPIFIYEIFYIWQKYNILSRYTSVSNRIFGGYSLSQKQVFASPRKWRRGFTDIASRFHLNRDAFSLISRWVRDSSLLACKFSKNMCIMKLQS